MDNIATKKVYRHGQHRERLSSAFDTETAKSLGLNTREVLPKKVGLRKSRITAIATHRAAFKGRVKSSRIRRAEHRLAMTQRSKV